MKKVEKNPEKLARQQVDTVLFHVRMCNHKRDFNFETVTKEILSKKEEFVRCICRFGGSF